jgi:nucleotide-binding universal stress UspA family protein
MLFPQSYAPEVTENAEVEERARSFVAESVAIAMGQPPPPFEIFVEHGTEYAEIVRCAETWRASLVVVGHGRRRGHLGGATGIA